MPLMSLRLIIVRLHCGLAVCMCDNVSVVQAADTVKLQICANSTRRALWHTRLGFHRSARPPVMSLQSLLAHGGAVPAVDVVVARVYPILVCTSVTYSLLNSEILALHLYVGRSSLLKNTYKVLCMWCDIYLQ